MRLLRLTLVLLTALACTRPTQDAGMVLNIDTDDTIDKSAIDAITVTVDGKANTWFISQSLPGNLGIVTSAGSKSVVVEGMAGTSTLGRWSGIIVVSKGKVTTQNVRLTCVMCGTPDGGQPPVDGSVGDTPGVGGVTGSGGATGTGGVPSSGGAGGLPAIDAGAGGASTGGTTGKGGASGSGGIPGTGGAGGLLSIDAGADGVSIGGTTGNGGASSTGGTSMGGTSAPGGITGSGGTVSSGSAGGVGGAVSSGSAGGVGGIISSGGAGAGGGGGAGGAGADAGVPKSCSTWTTVHFSDFNDGTLGGLSSCFGCSGFGCPNVVNKQLHCPAQWSLLCYPGLTASEARAIRISYDVTDQATMGSMGWDNFAKSLKTSLSSAVCGDGTITTHSVTYASPATTFVGHWELIRWGGNSFQFNHGGVPLGEIECALPALSGMAVDFHDSGNGRADSLIDNFRVEVCTSTP